MTATQNVDEQRERYRELLAELRTLLPGVQVLFAFLLTAPFANRFERLDAVGRGGYALALVSAALSTVLFLTPTGHHRIGPRRTRAQRLHVAIRTTIAGMGALAVAMVASIFVVTRFIYGASAGTAVAAVVLGGIAILWYAIPLRERLRRRDDRA